MSGLNIPKNCMRCGADLSAGCIMSKFNEDWICMACKEKERKHPDYAAASAAENAAVASTDWQAAREGRPFDRSGLNFPGIGKPADL